jgi:hypothetical protein
LAEVFALKPKHNALYLSWGKEPVMMLLMYTDFPVPVEDDDNLSLMNYNRRV